MCCGPVHLTRRRCTLPEIHSYLRQMIRLLNLLSFMIFGVVMLIINIVLTVDATKLIDFMWIQVLLVQPWLTIFVSFALAALGTYGSITEKKTPLIVFCVLMWIITVILVSYGTHIVVNVSQVISNAPETSQVFHKPLSIAAGLIFGLVPFTFVGGLLSMLMVRQIKQSSHVQTSIPPMDSPPLLTSEC